MLIREMLLTDINDIEELEKELFTSPWSKDDFLYEIEKNDFSRNLVLEDKGKCIGYIGFWLLGDQCQITAVGVKKKAQGHGYSKLLMKACFQETRQRNYPAITLEVRVSNQVAISLYQSCGFEIVATRKNYYQDTHEDAYLMLKEMEV